MPNGTSIQRAIIYFFPTKAVRCGGAKMGHKSHDLPSPNELCVSGVGIDVFARTMATDRRWSDCVTSVSWVNSLEHHVFPARVTFTLIMARR